MDRSVPPQVIPRPDSWRPGDPAPWSALREEERTGIGLARVLTALEGSGQRGPVPAGRDAARVLGPAIPVMETGLPAMREVNAGVLAALFEEGGEARVILTRRSSGLRTHRGEVSFPGGRIDPGEGPLEAAVREAQEEVGLEPALVTQVGWIHPVLTLVSASLIMPVLATLTARPPLAPNPSEVERVFDVSLAELAHPDVFHEELWRIPGRQVPGSVDGSFPMWFFEISGEMIWGATARMLYELLNVVLLSQDGALP